MTGRIAGLMLLTALLHGSAVEAQGRPLRARGLQDLNFGELLGGLPATVLPTDPLNAGQVEVSSERLSDVLVTFLLPPALVGPGGATIPLGFGPGSAGYSVERLVDNQLLFDPSVPLTVTLPRNGRTLFFLGGTAFPPAAATIGAYSASISLTVSYIGN